MQIKGQVAVWDWGGNPRKAIVGFMTYKQLKENTIEEVFDAATGDGNQRINDKKRVSYLENVVVNGKYVPQPITLEVRPDQRSNLIFDKGRVTINVDENDDSTKLLNINGSHRKTAFGQVGIDKVEVARKMESSPIPFLCLLDGNPAEDFVYVNDGKTVSRDHILSMKAAVGLVDKKTNEDVVLATKIAQLLHNENDSFCTNLIQFDTQSRERLPLSLNALCTTSAPKLPYSLAGSAKIAKQAGKTAEWVKDQILTVYRLIKDDPETEDLLGKGMVLQPIGKGGSATGTALLISIGNMLAERLRLLEQDEPTDDDLELLAICVDEQCNEKLNLANNRQKVQTFNKFCKAFFQDILSDYSVIENDDEADIPVRKIGSHEGIPVPTIALLSASGFGVGKLPTEGGKKRGRPKKAKSVDKAPAEPIVNVSESEDVVEGADPLPENPEWESEDRDCVLATANMSQDPVEDEDLEAPWED
jgi:hypothetical protein